MRRLAISLSIALFSIAGLLWAQSKKQAQATPSTPSTPAAAQGSQPPAADEDTVPQFVTSVKEVMVPVTVTDRDGNNVNFLTPLNFRLLDNRRPQEFTLDTAMHPISLVVAVQANAAVEKILPQINKIGSVFDDLVIGEHGELAVLAFDHRIQTMTPFTSDADQIHDAFKKIRPGSWASHLNEAAMEGLNMLRRRPSDRRRILVLISESRDVGSHYHVRDVLTEAEFADIVIYPIDISHLLTSLTAKPLPNPPNRIPPGGQTLPAGTIMTPTLDLQMNQNGNWVPLFKEMFVAVKAIFVPNPLEVYSQFTGGREYSFMSQRALEQAVSDIGSELHSQYLLTYSPNNQEEAGFHEIEVQVDKPDLKVRTRNGYWLAGKPK
ncbi:MAG: VWA domain-containing protein [Bryobacterales bacterium]|nr:VWA domain-containing protein [Bryobacterales bacterium]